MKVLRRYTESEAKVIEDALSGIPLTKSGTRVVIGAICSQIVRHGKIKIYIGVHSNWTKHRWLSLCREFLDENEADRFLARITERIDKAIENLPKEK
jgi:predicted nuclease of restriction endonuclease-like RecB superfamily